MTYGVDAPLYLDRVVGQKKCPECKKKFDWFGEQWTYKTKRNGTMHYYCSWTCWRAEDKRKGEKLRGSGYHKW